MKRRRSVLEGYVDPASRARHQHAKHEPSCPACDPAEYAAQDARHRSDVA